MVSGDLSNEENAMYSHFYYRFNAAFFIEKLENGVRH